MKVYGLPEHVPAPDFDECFVDGRYSMEKDNEVHEAFFKRVREYLRGELQCSGSLTGEIVYFPMGDGNAAYMVGERERVTFLIHLPIHDAWNLPEWQTRGLRKSDIKQRVEGERRMRELFSKKGN